jgi:hypothetical protein
VGANQWRQLVSKDDKEKLDEWYIANASIGLDLRIVLKTLQLMLRSRLSSQEAAADAEQVKGKDEQLGDPIPAPRAAPRAASRAPERTRRRNVA